jgi:hypothetical protein
MEGLTERLIDGSARSRLLFCLAVIGCMQSVGWAQRMDSFEGDPPRWSLVESDCEARLLEHEISLLMPRSGRACEMFEVSCVSGSSAIMAYPIEPCAVLDEFQPALWVRCASGQIRFGVRVVFPNAVHPVSQSRLTTVLWGDAYSQPGSWQRLQVQRIAEMLQLETIALRKQFDQPLDLEHPYIDSVALNVYTGPGRYRVQVDDLDLTGMIPLTAFGVRLNPNWRQSWRWREIVESRFESTHSTPIWIQHRGEPPAWLASLGFSGVLLSEVPSNLQLKSIHDAEMVAISPPPEHLVEVDQQHQGAIAGWMVGVAMNRDQAEVAKKRIHQAERLPDSLKRPTIGEPLEQFWQYSRLINHTIVPSPDPVSAGQLSAKRNWLKATIEEVRLRGDGWASIQATMNPAIDSQIRTAVERIQGSTEESYGESSTPTDPIGVRREVVAALMAGARGVVYRTQEPLTDPINFQGPQDRALQAAMRWTNQEIELWSPWISTGQILPPPQLNREDFWATRWRVKDADLILVQNRSPDSQWCMPATRIAPLTVSIRDSRDTAPVIRLTEGRLETMPVQLAEGSRQWQLDQPNPVEFFVVTGNPQVLAYLRRKLGQAATDNASDQLEIASYCLQLSADLIAARFGGGDALSESEEDQRILLAQQQRLMAIQRRLDGGWLALQSQQPVQATGHALVVIDQAQQIMHEAFTVATGNLATPQGSPFVLSPGALRYHWLVAQACARGQWQPLTIPGGQLTDLPQMLASGWTQQRRLADQFDWRVELIPSPQGGAGQLRMAAYSNISRQPSVPSSNPTAKSWASQEIPGGYEGASLRVRSAGVPVRRGQFIRVTATATIRHCDQNPAAGLLVYDNQAGPSLGQLVRGQAGQQVAVELYRFSVEDGQFRVLAECRGECDVQLGQISASLIEPATDRRSYETNPLARDPLSR